VTCIQPSGPGPSGSTTPPPTTASIPESLALVAHALNKLGCTTVIGAVPVSTQLLGLAVPSMNMAWLLTWYRTTTSGSERSGTVWVVTGEEVEIPFTLVSVGFPVAEESGVQPSGS
jgi:hypothetical protein